MQIKLSLRNWNFYVWDAGMLLEDFCMLEACCGSGASSRAIIVHMHRLGRRGRSRLIDFIPLERLLALHPELRLYIEDGSVIYFKVCLAQMRPDDLQLLVDGLLVKAQQLPCISGLHHMAMGLSE